MAAPELAQKVEFFWDICHSERGLYLEAHPDIAASSSIQWPQIVFAPGFKIQFYSDFDDLRQFGFHWAFQRVRNQTIAALRNWQREARTDLKLRFEHVTGLPSHANYPPRVFVRRRIRDFDERTSVTCRYRSERDREYALRGLGALGDIREMRLDGEYLGAHLPQFLVSCDLVSVNAALVKMAVNLVVKWAEDHDLPRPMFFQAGTWLRNYREPKCVRELLGAGGFTTQKSIDSLKCRTGFHRARLVHGAGFWHVFIAFFGGRLGMAVRVPGPRIGNDGTIDIDIPLDNDKWEYSAKRLAELTRPEFCVHDFSKVAPDLPFGPGPTQFSIEGRSSKEHRGRRNGSK